MPDLPPQRLITTDAGGLSPRSLSAGPPAASFGAIRFRGRPGAEGSDLFDTQGK